MGVNIKWSEVQNQFLCLGDEVGGDMGDGTDVYKGFAGKKTYWNPDGTPGYYGMFFFSIQNVKEYLIGEKAIV